MMKEEVDRIQESEFSSRNEEKNCHAALDAASRKNKPSAPQRLSARNSSISTEMIQKAKELDLPDLIRRRNIDLIPTNNGSSFKCKCPFHDDKDPSLNLNIKDGVWLYHCFGCGEGGTVIDFLMKYENMDFVQAVKSVSHETNAMPVRFPDIPLKPECSLENRIRLVTLAVQHFQKVLNSPAGGKGKIYLESRGILDEDLLKTFKIGFSDGNAKEALKDYRQELKSHIGLFSGSYHETFANCVIFPVMDEQGRPADIYGRRIINYSNRNNHCYNTGKHIGIFNYENVREAEEVILTEGIIDALSIYKAGFRNVTALFGVNGWTPGHDRLFNSGRVKRIIFSFDNDLAGVRGIQKYSTIPGLDISTVNFPETVKDANELYVKHGAEALQTAVKEAFHPSPEWIEEQIRKYKKEEGTIAEELTTNFTNNTNVKSLDSSVAKLLQNDNKKNVILNASEESSLNNPVNPVTNSPSDNSEFSSVQPSLSDLILPRFQFQGSDLIFESSLVSYRVRDVARLKRLNSLRFVMTANARESLADTIPITDRIDLYLLRSRSIFENKVAEAFKIQPAVIEKDFSAMISFIEADFKRRKISEQDEDKQPYQMSSGEEAEALKFLKSPNLIRNIIDDLSDLGYVGEDNNKLLLYLGATSRKLSKPISILIRSQSSTGKSFLIDIICGMMPPEDVHKWTSLTPKALYYMARDALKHKFIAIDEREGMEEAEYPIRSLQSGGTLSQAAPIKNPTTGQITTELIVKEGPISYVDGSTNTDTNPENANRCFEMYLDESAEQTRRIQERQKRAYSLEGLREAEKKDAVKRKHQNSQRLLRHVKTVIPFINLIEFPSDWIRTRRDHDRFLSLVVCVAFLHQYQREQRQINGETYIEADLRDYAIAYKIAKTVLFNTFQELEKPVFDFYLQLNAMVESNAKGEGIKPEEYKFSRRDIRKKIRLQDYLVHRYMKVLVRLEYCEIAKGGENGSRHFYRLIEIAGKYTFLAGLTTPSQLKAKMEQKK